MQLYVSINCCLVRYVPRERQEYLSATRRLSGTKTASIPEFGVPFSATLRTPMFDNGIVGIQVVWKEFGFESAGVSICSRIATIPEHAGTD